MLNVRTAVLAHLQESNIQVTNDGMLHHGDKEMHASAYAPVIRILKYHKATIRGGSIYDEIGGGSITLLPTPDEEAKPKTRKVKAVK